MTPEPCSIASLELRNDLGLLSEEYDTVAGRLVGNFPQAFSHVSLVNTASKLAGEAKPTLEQRCAHPGRRRGMTRSKTGSGRLHRMGQQSLHKARRGAAGTRRCCSPPAQNAKTASSPRVRWERRERRQQRTPAADRPSTVFGLTTARPTHRPPRYRPPDSPPASLPPASLPPA